MENEKKYYLGLDIGTDSVGYAVTDTTPLYKLVKFHGEPMWGVHLFDAANTKAERRAFRTARRRLDRRQQRIKLLQEIFAKEISKVDPKFFQRIQESGLLRSDSAEPYCLFNDKTYTDKTYHVHFPTIHHLIMHLIHDQGKNDVRLVYLACAWLLAHRGHFLFEMSPDDEFSADFESVYKQLTEFYEELDVRNPWDAVDTAKLAERIKVKVSVGKKESAIKEILYPDGKCPKAILDDDFPFNQAMIVKLLAGGTAKLKDLFGKEEYADLEQSSVSLGMDDETFDIALREIGDDAGLLLKLKALYDWGLLQDILGEGNDYISEAKIQQYDIHKKDLRELKTLFRKYFSKDEYDKFFTVVEKDLPNYVAYSGFTSKAKGNIKEFKRTTKDEFYKYVKNKLEGLDVSKKDQGIVDSIVERINNGSYMPKQKTGDNRVIPYQFYYKELKEILNNASKYLSFLNEETDGLDNKSKILSIMKYRIPYYVGPLNNHSEFSWIERKAEGRILPWNFKDIIDLDASEQAFIRRMVNGCTYLPDEKVLPKHSMSYEKFEVLNEINNISVNSMRIDVNVKKGIFNNLFMKRKKVTIKMLKEYLISQGFCSREDIDTLSGIDTEGIKSSLASYFKFSQLLGRGLLTDDDIERIISRATITESKSRFAKWLENEYGKLSEADKTYIKKLSFSDFGRLSEKFLNRFEGTELETGETNTILGFMWDKNINLMELLSKDKFTFYSQLEDYQRNYYSDRKLTLEQRFDDMYISTSVRRPIYRTLDIVNDVVSAMKTAPAKIFIEMARGSIEDKKDRTKSRKDQLLELYKDVRDEDIKLLKEQLESMGDSANNKLQSEALFLYYLQLGKCMYSGKPIDITKLGDGTYNIDHIYPQSKVKDDSIINNKVLVLSEYNHNKGDSYPIPAEWRHSMESYWRYLKDNKLISKEKYDRLVRKTAFTEEEEQNFINRQIVETRQATKALATILKDRYPESKIVYVKAGLVSDFRKEYGFVKCRSINDLHHAKDAYLNIICGNVYNEHFTKAWFNDMKASGGRYNISLSKLLGEYKRKTKTEVLPEGRMRITNEILTDEEGNKIFDGRFVKNGMDVVWDGATSFSSVRDSVRKNNVHMTKYAFCRKGGLFAQQPLKAAEGLIPRKKNLTSEKYGGYSKPSIAFFILVKAAIEKKKGKEMAEVMFVPIEQVNAHKFYEDKDSSNSCIIDRIKQLTGREAKRIEFPIGVTPIKINTAILLEGFLYTISGVSNGGEKIIISPFVPLSVTEEKEAYLKRVESMVEKVKKNPKYKYDYSFDKVNTDDNLSVYDLFVKKLNETIFSRRINSPAKVLLDGRTEFTKLDVISQSKVLMEIIKVFGRASGGIDFSDIKGKAHGASTTISSKLSNWKGVKNAKLLFQSPSGLWKKESCNLIELL